MPNSDARQRIKQYSADAQLSGRLREDKLPWTELMDKAMLAAYQDKGAAPEDVRAACDKIPMHAHMKQARLCLLMNTGLRSAWRLLLSIFSHLFHMSLCLTHITNIQVALLEPALHSATMSQFVSLCFIFCRHAIVISVSVTMSILTAMPFPLSVDC